MKLYVMLDFTAQLIDVPQHVIENKDFYRNKFLDWLYNQKIKHQYRTKALYASGHVFVGMCYDAGAFVEWLNKKVLSKSGDKATIIATNLDIDERAWKDAGIPFIFF